MVPSFLDHTSFVMQFHLSNVVSLSQQVYQKEGNPSNHDALKLNSMSYRAIGLSDTE